LVRFNGDCDEKSSEILDFAPGEKLLELERPIPVFFFQSPSDILDDKSYVAMV
jgi:hypothetical protein